MGYLKNPLLGVLGAWMTFKKPEMDKTLKNGVKYDWNGSPQPQMVGFRDLVGTGIAPVSKKTAVKTKMIATPFSNCCLLTVAFWCHAIHKKVLQRFDTKWWCKYMPLKFFSNPTSWMGIYFKKWQKKYKWWSDPIFM